MDSLSIDAFGGFGLFALQLLADLLETSTPAEDIIVEGVRPLMDPLLLGAIVGAVWVISILFSGISVANGLLVVSALFLIIFDGLRALELIPEVLFGKLDNFALLSIPMFILMGAAIATLELVPICTKHSTVG